jgi:hypothetical protein
LPDASPLQVMCLYHSTAKPGKSIKSTSKYVPANTSTAVIDPRVGVPQSGACRYAHGSAPDQGSACGGHGYRDDHTSGETTILGAFPHRFAFFQAFFQNLPGAHQQGVTTLM